MRYHWGGGAGDLALQGEAVGPGLVQPGEGVTLRAPSSIPSISRRGWRRCSQALHRGVWWEGERQQQKLKHERLRLELRRSLFPMRRTEVGLRPREVVLFSTLGRFVPWLDEALSSSVGAHSWAYSGQGLGLETSTPASLNCPATSVDCLPHCTWRNGSTEKSGASSYDPRLHRKTMAKQGI